MSSDFELDDCWNRIGVRGDRSCDRLREVSHCRNCPVHESAARRIMQRRAPDDYARYWAAEFAMPVADQTDAGGANVIFRIGVEWLALPMHCCIQVADQAPVHYLPHRTGKVLTGLVNINGKLTAQVSLAALLGIDTTQTPTIGDRHVYARLLVLRIGERIVAAPVDEIRGMARLRDGELHSPPATVNKSIAHQLTGVWTIDALQVGYLDAALLGYNAMQALS